VDLRYASSVMLLLNIKLELNDLFKLLKDKILIISYEKLPSLRAKSIKVIRDLVEIRTDNLLDDFVLKIVQSRLSDDSSSTRESTIDLISKFILKGKEFFEKYLPVVQGMIYDPSLTVRKKVITSLCKVIEANEIAGVTWQDK